MGCLRSWTRVSSVTPCRAGRLLPVLVGPPGTVVTDPGSVLAVSEKGNVDVGPDATGGVLPSGLSPCPEPRRKKKAMMKMATRAVTSARSLA